MPPSVSQPHQQDFINVGVSFNLVLSIFSSRAVAGRTAVVSKGVCAHLMPETHISDKPKNVRSHDPRAGNQGLGALRRRRVATWPTQCFLFCNLLMQLLKADHSEPMHVWLFGLACSVQVRVLLAASRLTTAAHRCSQAPVVSEAFHTVMGVSLLI